MSLFDYLIYFPTWFLQSWVGYKPSGTSTSLTAQATLLAPLPNKRQCSGSQVPTTASSALMLSGITYDDLPYGTNRQLYRKIFIPTTIQYIAHELNPWGLPSMQLIPILQTIWDEVVGISIDVTAQSAVYQLVSNTYNVHLVTNQAPQTMQCVSDSWHSAIGSAAVLALSAFFYQNKVTYPTDNI